MLFTFLLIVQTIVAVSLCTVILLQRSEGGGLGVGGSSAGFMTARGAADFLSRATSWLGGAFIIASQPWYTRKLKANNNIPVPEWRLPPAIVGAIAFAGGLFWFGWTGYTKNIHWIAPTLSGLLTGFGLMSIFLQCMNYLIDAYLVL